MAKLNCWDFHKCGRNPGGARSRELGVCPASEESRLHGEHGGANAGRTCWVVAGTLCGGEVQGSFVQKNGTCMSCDFYKQVKNEEGTEFRLSIVLLNKLRDKAKAAAAGH